MKIIVNEDKANKFVFEIEGLGHTFCNSLKEELRENDNVLVAAYNITHPLKGVTKFFLETKGEKPKDALEKAVKSLKKKNNDFLKSFNSMK
ncbi:DNA-directed RNA polymerase subunit L [Candidatus Woesearchaeota archaeon]|nr:DNA-directed RNA polymerase subunit L [Candidatus Woesearchaeota archaeon]MCF7901174.1 DNA-directed RNA polymerase subunit L [Candidatus Woesearchaeota archaeon]MCF8013812.1 DNA-directed RNA polymerase subunit L [Candidatus Woesearchaeota archaeon]